MHDSVKENIILKNSIYSSENRCVIHFGGKL